MFTPLLLPDGNLKTLSAFRDKNRKMFPVFYNKKAAENKFHGFRVHYEFIFPKHTGSDNPRYFQSSKAYMQSFLI